MDEKIKVSKTPNPNSLKFEVGFNWVSQSYEFKTPLQARISPLALKLFSFPWVDHIFIQKKALILTKQDWVEWDILEKPLKELILNHLDNKEKVVLELEDKKEKKDKNESEEVLKIKQVIESTIRPFIQEDGGDIVFQKYEGFKVYVSLKGACISCPSSTLTLKKAVFETLKNYLPEIKEVISV